jgi:hypothetical protein
MGALASEEELRVYGYLTNTRAKLVVVVDDAVVKDDEMRAVSGCWERGWVCSGGAGGGVCVRECARGSRPRGVETHAAKP